MMTTMDTAAAKQWDAIEKLSKMSNDLSMQRAMIHNHCIGPCVSDTVRHSTFVSMMKKYAENDAEYRVELDSFWNVLQSAWDILKENDPNHSLKTNGADEIRSNYPISDNQVSHNLSTAYSHVDSDGSNGSRPSTASNESTVSSESHVIGVPEPAQQMMVRKSVEREPESKVDSEPEAIPEPALKPEPEPEPELQPKAVPESAPEPATDTAPAVPPAVPVPESVPKPVSESKVNAQSVASAQDTTSKAPSTASVNEFGIIPRRIGKLVPVNNLRAKSSYKCSGKGFAVWKKNHCQKLYTNTELYCTKTFGGDDGKLKRYLVNKGGFKREQIKSVQTFQVQDRNSQKMTHHARIYVDGKIEDIQSGIDQLENSRGENKDNVIWISRPKRNERGNLLMVRNFDILTEKDHRKFTRMFSNFGPLQSEIQMGRNNNGVNYALVTFRDTKDARKCERAQNDSRWAQDQELSPLKFNERTLQIGYAAEREVTNGKGTGGRNQRRNRNSRR